MDFYKRKKLAKEIIDSCLTLKMPRAEIEGKVSFDTGMSKRTVETILLWFKAIHKIDIDKATGEIIYKEE